MVALAMRGAQVVKIIGATQGGRDVVVCREGEWALLGRVVDEPAAQPAGASVGAQDGSVAPVGGAVCFAWGHADQGRACV